MNTNFPFEKQGRKGFIFEFDYLSFVVDDSFFCAKRTALLSKWWRATNWKSSITWK
jgi:hypothetical protein